MPTLDELLQSETPQQIIAALKEKSISVPSWTGRKGLREAYDPAKHPVMNKALYPDITNDDGTVTHVTRITYDLQRLAVKRTTELVCGIPVKRVYKPENDRQQEVASVLEKIYERNRIDSVNIERLTLLFSGCEFMTLWYAVEEDNNLYGIQSKIKLRCRNFSPVYGDELYPLFDEYGDMIAMSVGYNRKVGGKNISYFDAYTKDRHLKFSSEGGWHIVENEPITLGKIPAVYVYRPTPIWEDTSKIVYEMEWAMSRNGNYLRENSKPLFCLFADEEVRWGDEGIDDPDNVKGKAVAQYPKGSSAAYITWEQAVENLKFYITELRQTFFTQLQLPDWSYESMKASPMSGESRKQLFIDAQLKVKDESGRLLECFDREVNVVKAYATVIMGEGYAEDINALPVENIITPFTISDDTDTIQNLVLANGNKPLISQRESVELLGWSSDVDKTLEEINADKMGDVFNPAM